MKTIEIDEELYHFIASQTKHIGEDASSILRRLLKINQPVKAKTNIVSQPETQYTLFNDLLDSDLFINEKSIISRFILLLGAQIGRASCRERV